MIAGSSSGWPPRSSPSEPGGKVRLWQGNYSTWRGLAKAAADEKPALSPSAVRPVESRPAPAPKKGLSFAEKRELDGLMPRIEVIEAALKVLEGELADPRLYAERGAEVGDKLAQKEKRQAELTTLLARWEDLESRSAG
jgi:ATP-binding cassette subfamily F protein uup